MTQDLPLNNFKVKLPLIAGLTIRILETPAEVEASQKLRFEVWSGEGAILHDGKTGVISDAHDIHSHHWGVFDGANLVASARLCIHLNLADTPDAAMFDEDAVVSPIGCMNRLVVLRRYRRQGIRTHLDALRIEFSRVAKCRSMLITPIDVPARISQLRSLGFENTGKIGKPGWGDVQIAAMIMKL